VYTRALSKASGFFRGNRFEFEARRFRKEKEHYERLPARHKDLAELVGASRPRVTGYIALLEREHMIIREGRQLIIRRDRLESFLAQRHSSANGRDLEETLAS
jgi:hypothetical protein